MTSPVPTLAALHVPSATELAEYATAVNALQQNTQVLGAAKTADTTRTSTTTLQDDPHLQVSGLIANASYALHLLGTYNAAATPDLKVNFDVPSGATGSFGGQDGTVVFAGVSLGSDFGFAASGGATVRLEIWGTFTLSSTPGALAVQSAQIVSNAGASTMHSGMILRVYRIG
jgi:hypothetical protein